MIELKLSSFLTEKEAGTDVWREDDVFYWKSFKQKKKQDFFTTGKLHSIRKCWFFWLLLLVYSEVKQRERHTQTLYLIRKIII